MGEPETPAPEPTAAPTLGAGSSPSTQAEWSQAGIGGIVQQVFGPQAGTALAVAWCESKYDPAAVSMDGTSYGLMQLHAPTWAPVFPDFWQRWSDPEWNVTTAWEIYKRAGYSFAPWACW